MGGARIRLLDEDDIRAIDEAARVLLYHTGVSVQSRAARDLLASVGCRTASGSPRVLIPERAINKALDAAPKKVLLASRDRKHDLTIPDGRPHVTTDGCGVNIWDLATGQRRPGTSGDLADLTRVADALDAVELQWPMSVAGEVPNEVHDLVEVGVTLENTTKHVQHEATSGGEAGKFVAMAVAVAGGEQELRRRPVVSSVQCPVSPLILEQGSTDALIVFARAGVPVVPISMILLGGSSPVDLASALVTAHAENLASLCVSETASPGAPVIYSVSSGPIDMRTGSFACGSPEASLMSVAGVEMTRFLDLPCLVGGLSCDAAEPGFQAGIEKLGSGLPAMIAGGDLVTGVGSLETDNALSAEQLVLDADMVSYARRLLEPFRVDADSIHLDLLSRLGPGGNYLKEKHTLQHFRELWNPQTFVRDGYVAGKETEMRVRERARARAREILAGHHPAPLDPETRKAVWAAAGVPPP